MERKIRNRTVLAYCDHQIAIDVINKGVAKNTFSQAHLGEICFLLAKYNAMVKLVYYLLVKTESQIAIAGGKKNLNKNKFWQSVSGKTVKFLTVREHKFHFSQGW